MKRDQDLNTKLYPPQWIRIIAVLFFLVIPFQSDLIAQHIRLDADQEALNHVLIRMVEDYGIQLSFDDRHLSQYMVSVHHDFKSAEEAIAFLLQEIPLEYQLVDEVYIIFKKERESGSSRYRISGIITDRYSGEALPHSHLIVNMHGMTTDFSGHFSATSSLAPEFKLTVSHLGYYLLDTTLRAGHQHVIGLVPSLYELEEVDIMGSQVERSGQVGEEPGELRLNHKIAYRLPGNGDDAVFNFLRLQPGIMAAGEQSSEMIIWGGYTGNSQLLFDGFTIFGPRNFNDNISFVNPFMAKEIRVLKGGYSAEFGERVGGIVEISGIEGNRSKPAFNLNVNNMTMSAMASVPVGARAALTGAFRHTYYNLYDASDLGISHYREDANPNSGVDITVFPDYLFRDANLKYAGTTKGGDPYFISLYAGGDLFSYETEEEKNRLMISQEVVEKSRQLGGTAFIGRTWDSGPRSNFSLSYSGMNKDISESQEIHHKEQGFLISSVQTQYLSNVEEVVFRNTNHLNLWETHSLMSGLGYVYSNIVFQQDFEDVLPNDGLKKIGRLNLFIQDTYHPLPSLSLKTGLRMDYPFSLRQIFLQPRIQFSLKLGEDWRVKGAWGLYNQFIAETSILDDFGNYRYFWVICDNETIPVLHAQHIVGGIIYRQPRLTLSLEPFFKTVKGITRLVTGIDGNQRLYAGRARMYGADFLAKYYFRKHEAWISYTLGRAEEYLSGINTGGYSVAPQDQRHEIKGALLMDLKPFYFSVNYVYGSGLAYRSANLPEEGDRYPYSRFDVALIYRLKLERARMEAGISVLNLFNRENIKYSNLFEVPDGQFSSISIYAEAVPFTPTIYLNLAF